MQNHFQDLSITALDAFVNTLNVELEISAQRQLEKDSNMADNEPPFARLKQALAQTLSDFQWTDIDIAYLASPGRLRRTPRSMRQTRNGPLETRNHIYVVSSIPHTYSDLMWYFQLRSESAVQTHLTREGDKMTIVKLMDNAAMEMKKTLWDGFVDHRISLNWIDIWPHLTEELSAADKDIKEFIGTSFQSIAKIFGGYLLPFSLLHHDISEQYGISIQNLMYYYTSKSIDTSNDFVRSKKSSANVTKPSLLDVIQSSQITDKVVWAGDLILDETNTSADDPDIHKLKLLVHNFLRPNLSNSLIDIASANNDTILSIDECLSSIKSMTCFLLLPAACVPLKWYQMERNPRLTAMRSNFFLCTLEHGSDLNSMSRFENLLLSLNENQLVLIVGLEHQDTMKAEYKYAALESVAHSCAAIAFLNCDTDELLALVPSNDSVDATIDEQLLGTTVFDPWTSRNFDIWNRDMEESSLLYSIDCTMPEELQNATAANTLLQSPMDSALTGEPVIVNAAENENGETYDANVADATNERNTMPATLDEFQSHWIGIYLPSLYLSSIEPDAIAGKLHTWANHLEHTMGIPPSDILAAIKQLPMSFSNFDTKHKELCNASGILTDELAKHLVEDEVDILEKWKYTRQLDSKNLRVLKIKDAQLQILVMLKILELEKRYMTLNKIELPKQEKKKSKKKKCKAKDNLYQQLELYFDRLCIWDSMMDAPMLTSATSTTGATQKSPEDTILTLRVLCKHLSDIYRPILPDTIDQLWARSGGEEEPQLFEPDRAQPSNSLTQPTPMPEKSFRFSKKTPMDANARVKLLESRIRGPSNETTVTDAAWATKSDSKQIQKSASNANLLSGSRKLPSSTVNLPFMKREIEMTKSLSTSSRSKSKPSKTVLPQARPSGSRRKITTPKKIPIAVMDGKNTETVVLRKRQALSPTTPRTRAERDFGLRLARTPTKGPSVLPISAKRSTDAMDSPMTSSPRKLMRTFSGSRSPTAQRQRTNLPISRARLSPNSPSHNRIKTNKPADLSEIAPKRDLFTSFLEASSKVNGNVDI